MTDIVGELLSSDSACIRYQARLQLAGDDANAPDMQQLQAQIPEDEIVQRLLSERQADGSIPRKAYHKWCGPHWVLTALADLGYPPGEDSLAPLREQVMDWLFKDLHVKYMSKRFVNGRMRMHPSIEGNAVYYLIQLGLADERVDHLVQLMLDWRWPDGGWN